MLPVPNTPLLDELEGLNKTSQPFPTAEIDTLRKSNKAVALQVDDIAPPEMQIKARSDLVKSYPPRFKVEDWQRSWEVALEDYRPTYFVHPHVLEQDSSKNSEGWAEPENLSPSSFEQKKLNDPIWSTRPDIQLAPISKHPLNPAGRTGIEGRGLLGLWGPNFAVDNIVVFQDPNSKQFNVLLIQRKDGTWAFPGGMVDRGENKEVSLPRELEEEAGISLGDTPRKEIFSGFCDDPRNTDNAWMETSAFLILLDAKQALNLKPVAGSDAKNWKWMAMTTDSIKELYASHPWIAQITMQKLGFDDLQ